MTALVPGSTPVIPAINDLAHAIAALAKSDGDHATTLPALSLHRRQGLTAPLHCIFKLGLGVVAQGDKQALLGDQLVRYGPGQSMLTSIELPVISHVTRASVQQPLLGLMLTLDRQEIAEAVAAMGLAAPTRATDYAPITVEQLDERLTRDLVRLVEVLGEPSLAPLLAPLIKCEIVFRLLLGPHGPALRQIAADGTPSQQISNAVAWLRQNFAKPMQMDDLAARVHMSPSTFRQHFRAMTGTSPLQYQKQLRLQEARQLMLLQDVDAGTAGSLVGYESPSHFSREYNRLFGSPPQQDVRRLRLSDGGQALAS